MRVIDETGQQLGVLSASDALRIAREKGLDLIMVSESAIPPVCKIEELGKFKYELEKKERLQKKKQKVTHIKEVRVRPQIGEHDFMIKLANIKRFLEEGDKVKLSIVFRGREIAYKERGNKLLERLNTELSGLFVFEQAPRQEGMYKIAIIAPVKK
ncbi:translation initiation factor IF-3 [Candidatus Desantisbacteria bacterium CG_4_10_14_0_8_um_filter_48_22]|uniref:Translation initiation factor IF-3 n=1 Tax=Candidatus Desantisbacteria bacterium CG_4_10_14_0_8_um_filter_48_22 TaxID=1974543 RepID=A0A2M7SC82_9BACT|nr:MAG: translation initiation factor IF-3 [Candidatus Desantisbacteria bacterium CG1_02_49_89]PIZ17079.1 MAG: translation initiation factor IF-3 [Candidatus Desantisbacteria bacterium CG_4_10_14_0_8_um_filter_48_22]PJB27203.1 MAG: translation initiation factor IF-3 [Candidatus Desantisbacteria bacterium CG_4_9_14_3_um_filter_50_7]